MRTRTRVCVDELCSSTSRRGKYSREQNTGYLIFDCLDCFNLVVQKCALCVEDWGVRHNHRYLKVHGFLGADFSGMGNTLSVEGSLQHAQLNVVCLHLQVLHEVVKHFHVWSNTAGLHKFCDSMCKVVQQVQHTGALHLSSSCTLSSLVPVI